jgi:hypothetical protein
MAGGLIQVISYGNQDIMLTGNPEITFFNIIYRRYTNFGKKMIELPFDNTVNFGESAVLTIPKNSGDLLSKLVLKIKLPSITFQNLNNFIIKNELVSNTQSNSTYVLYYDFFIDFYNNITNLVDIFFSDTTNETTLTYIKDLGNFIAQKINNDKYEQFYTSVNFYFNDGLISEENFVDVSLFTNASLYTKINENFVYVYQDLNEEEVSYNEFKFTIYKNMGILKELNTVMYNKLKNLFFNKNLIKFSWINKIGIYLFNSIELYIGSNKIVKLSDYYINNYGDLWYKNPEVYNQMIGNNVSLNLFTLNREEEYLYLPIPFWFLNNYGLAFPLISLQFNTLQIRINLKSFIECIKVDVNKEIINTKLEAKIIDYIINSEKDIIKTPLEVSMLAEYVYLDSIERKKFAQSAHEYLITQVQELEFDNLSSTNNSFGLDFFHCCKDMYWQVVKLKDYRDIFSSIIDSQTYSLLSSSSSFNENEIIFSNYIKTLYDPYNYFNPDFFVKGRALLNNEVFINSFIDFILSNMVKDYTKLKRFEPLITSSFIYLNGTLLIGENSNFFNYGIPFKYYNSSPEEGIYSYSFALNPTETQPSGTINLSRIPSFHIKVKFNDSINLALKTNDEISLTGGITNVVDNKFIYTNIKFRLVVQVTNFNVLRIIGGIGATAYSY